MLLKNIDYLVTQNPEREVLEDIDVLIRGDRIDCIGRDLQADVETVDCSGKLVMPGLVNAHTHSSMTLLRGISDNKKLKDWLEEDIFPAEEKLEPKDFYAGSLIATIEMLKTGTTCFNDMYFNLDRIVEAVEHTGIRAVLGRGLTDIDGDREEKLRETVEFIENYSSHDLVTPAVAPHSVYTCSNDLLVEAAYIADLSGSIYHIHVSETEKENQDSIDENGETPVQHLDSLGVLDEESVAAHGTHLSNEDLEILERRGVSVVHNPAANLKLGSGVADIVELRENGVNVGLGTDGPASNNSLNMFEEMKLAALLQKNSDPEQLTEQEALDMSTIESAKAIGMGKEIGSIEPGKKADIVMIDLDRPSLTPFHGKKGLVSNLVFSFNGNVDDVIVNGEMVVRDSRICNFNEELVYSRNQDISSRFR